MLVKHAWEFQARSTNHRYIRIPIDEPPQRIHFLGQIMLPDLSYPALVHNPSARLLVDSTMCRLLKSRTMCERNLRSMTCQSCPSTNTHPAACTAEALRQAEGIPIHREWIYVAVRVHESWIAAQCRWRQSRGVPLRVRMVLLVMRHAIRATAESLHRWAHHFRKNFDSRRVASSERRSWAEREAQPGVDTYTMLRDVTFEFL